MIARIWKGTTRAGDADAYADYMAATGVAEIEALDGNRGVVLMRRIVDGAAEFTFVSYWMDMDSIKAFAGEKPQRAVFYPEDDRYLITRALEVEHHDVVGGHAAGDRFGAPNIPKHGTAQANDSR